MDKKDRDNPYELGTEHREQPMSDEKRRTFEAKERREKNPSNEETEMRNIAAECAEYTPVYNDTLVSLSATEALERSCGTCAHFDGGECDIYQRESGAYQKGDTRGRQ